MLAEDFKTGRQFYVALGDGKPVPVKMATLFRKVGQSVVYGLTNQSEKLLGCRDKVYVDDEKKIPVGRLSAHDVFPVDDNLGNLFNVIRFEPDATAVIEKSLSDVAYTRDLQHHIWRSKPLRVRKTVPRVVDNVKRNRNTQGRAYNVYKGLLVGDVRNAQVELRDSHVTIPHAARARSSGERSIASEGDGAAPVLSKSKALLGFVIGATDDELLIFPAEDFSRTYGVTFVAPPLEQNVMRLHLRHPQP